MSDSAHYPPNPDHKFDLALALALSRFPKHAWLMGRLKIADVPPPKDRPVFLAGGTLEGGSYRQHHDDDAPESWIVAPVRAHWIDPQWDGGPGRWQVVCYDCGVMSVDYNDPTHWMDIPPLDVQS